MLDSIRALLQDLAGQLNWAPETLVAVIVLAMSVAVALLLHCGLRRLVSRFLARRWQPLRRILARTGGPTRLAFLIVALMVAVPAAPLDPDTQSVIARALLIAVIALIGWTCLITLRLMADFYLLRFRVDVEDNLLARKHVTQVRVLLRVIDTIVVIVTVGATLMTFASVRQYGVSLFASAGVAGLVAGLAARPVLSNLFAGVQLAITQPIRIEDAVIVENEWGWIEEITSTYVVVRLWDWRRMVVPLSYFIEKPFQNWTRQGAELIGSVLLYLDYTAPIDAIRAKAEELAKASTLWNGKVVNVQVSDAKANVIEVRVLVSANNASAVWDLRCEMREKLIGFLAREHPLALPRGRNESVTNPQPQGHGDAPLAPDGDGKQHEQQKSN
ncbi:MAG TPA: mechanosensitive ion channel family protein [Pseudolabrys sp.]|nr:mechanosensitive ion channel family protein [Pseudolabrys sp.]